MTTTDQESLTGEELDRLIVGLGLDHNNAGFVTMPAADAHAIIAQARRAFPPFSEVNVQDAD